MIPSPEQFLTELIGRIDGPMKFRLYLQPAMAIFFGIRNGGGDVRAGRKPYGWALLTDPEERQFLLHDGWKGICKVFLLALVLDFVYQYLAIGAFRPVEALVMGALVALVPYVLVRGLTNWVSPKPRER